MSYIIKRTSAGNFDPTQYYTKTSLNSILNANFVPKLGNTTFQAGTGIFTEGLINDLQTDHIYSATGEMGKAYIREFSTDTSNSNLASAITGSFDHVFCSTSGSFGGILVSNNCTVGDVIVSGSSQKTTFPTPENFGCVGNGTSDDTTALTSMITSAGNKTVYGDRSKTYYTATLNDIVGTKYEDNIRIKKGSYLYNSYAHKQYIFGQENLYGWYAKVRANTATKIVMSGDSTTFGYNVDRNNSPSQIMSFLARSDGYNMTFLEYGVGGAQTSAWLSTYLTNEKAENPDLWVIRWGINDFANNRTMTQYITDLRAGLASIRSTFPLSGGVGIILMSPTSAEYAGLATSIGSLEECARAVKRASIDYNCAFIDTYALWQNTRDSGSLWMDAGKVHPTQLMYQLIMSSIYSVMIPNSIDIFSRYGVQKWTGRMKTSTVSVQIPDPTTCLFFASGKSLAPELPLNTGTNTIASYATQLTTPTITNNKWVIASGANYVSFTGINDGGQVGCIRATYEMPYTTKPPTSNYAFFWFGYGSNPNNQILLTHSKTDGTIALTIFATGTAIINGVNLGVWTCTTGVSYEFELDWDLTLGETRLFIDGIQQGSTQTATGTRGPAYLLWAGANPTTTTISDMCVYSTVQHTANYTPNNVSTVSRDRVQTNLVSTSEIVCSKTGTFNNITVASSGSFGGLYDTGDLYCQKTGSFSNVVVSSSGSFGGLYDTGDLYCQKTGSFSNIVVSSSGSFGGVRITNNCTALGTGSFGSIYLATPDGTPSGLNCYEETTHSCNMIGAASTVSYTITVVKIGRLVILLLPRFSTSAIDNYPLYTDTGLATRFTPTTNDIYSSSMITFSNSTTDWGTVRINTSGVITIYRGWNGSFTISTTSGFEKNCISYIV